MLNNLEKASFHDDSWPLWDLIGVLTMPGIVRLKAAIAGEMAGFIAGDQRGADGVGWITTLAVFPPFRRMGMGRALLLECETRMDVERVNLCVRKSNTGAINLYMAEGYQPLRTWSAYYSDREDALVMEKLLLKPVDLRSIKG